ncbi:DUF3488 domain-containing protein [Stieleria sp. TO1_6]|uniref:DUF3488 domain-containing protein n=1 Tax=Stieleria tagensis TaxID=2956795 RepID=UPI00209A8818|nr:DUF3488 domain-containing protein [Stieleria tagensis]MCO8124459.1 DUF3488 domain-containing protein [Stieleria tagensis]
METTENSDDSFTKFLYNHNPFYLISCLLVIYGCQSLAVSGGTLLDKSLWMTGGIAAYTVLMAVVCIAVVRLANVWDDARSIFIVVLLSLVAATTGFDELCIGDQSAALVLGAAVAGLVLIVIESVLWCSRIRLSFWYRVTLYFHFALLIGFPLILGRAVANRNDSLAGWGSVLFSIAVGGGALLLIPALRRGTASIEGNGTPWSWPLYPLSAFIVLLVLAGIRAHAIWMAFGFYGTAGRFEPFLLLPMAAAVAILIAETGLGLGKRSLQHVALYGAPLLLLCGLSNHGSTWLPIQSELQYTFGSGLTVACLVLLVVYGWMTVRGVRDAVFGLPLTLIVAAVFAPVPPTIAQIGFQSWMLLALAGVILLWITIRRNHPDWLWTSLAGIATGMIAMIGDSLGYRIEGMVAAVLYATLSMLLIGALYPTLLAVCLRHLAALLMSIAVGVVAFRSLRFPDDAWVYLALGAATVAIVYGVIVKRRGWLTVGLVQGLVFCVLLGIQSHRTGKLRRVNWPIASGLMCLGVGIAITTGKTGLYRRLGRLDSGEGGGGYQAGL